MAATQSRWRLAANAALQQAMTTMPKTDNIRLIRKHLSAAYPFGPREGHPYKIWLSEIKKFLPTLRKEPEQTRYQLRTIPGGKPWIVVRCDWCNNQENGITRGCIVCREHVDTLAELLSPGSDALAFLRTIRADPEDRTARGVFADWLDDRGHWELAELFRRVE